MPIDEYKTQVLLLHSEQTALDSLSSGFGERYTVHCATSGSEALNTMIDTPINVIISAQDLPGMSGLEALKEAKKRSPETIGILLAESGQEAIVGEEEVFQVVSGEVTGDGLKRLVDNATRQMRLMALADSANDTKADPDLTAEHIVMETSENGSTIISDGTGRLPVLDPKKVSAAQSVGARSVDVLVLTKDQEFLETIKDSSRGMHEVHYANTLKQADDIIRKHKVGVAVVDAAMVGDKVEQLTQHLRKGSARLVSIVAGRRDDGEMLMDLINRGKVYRFLLKPVSPGRARLAVEASVKHHLEAPDAAFKMSAAAAKPATPTPAPTAKAKPEPRPAPKPAPKPETKAKAEKKPAAPKISKPKPVAKPAEPVDPPLGSSEAPMGGSPIEDGLADAFGADDSSFTETVTGLVSNIVGKSEKKKARKEKKSEKPAVDANVEAELPPLVDISLDSTDGTGSDGLLQPKLIGMAAAAVVVLAGAVYWFVGGDSDETPQSVVQEVETPAPAASITTSPEPSITEADVVFDEAPLGGAGVDIEGMLEEGRAARDAGQIFNPPGGNAIDLFSEALAADPNNAIIVAELDATIGEALGMAETAMLEGRLDDAEAALQRVAGAMPGHDRLPFMTAQLSQMQLRTRLDDARTAIRESRFEDAAASIASARSLNVGDSSEISAIEAELSMARSEQQVDEVLAKANARLESGALLSPANDNARYYYQLALSIDSGNTPAQQGLNVIASRLVLQARAEIDAGNLDAADRLLSDARAIDASNADLAATANAVQSARAEIEAAERAEQARLQAEAERRAELEAEAEAERQRIAAAPLNEIEVANQRRETVVEPVAESKPEPAPTQSQVSASPAPASVSSLTRTRYVAPKYPRMAERRNQSGWVDVVFTVGIDGTVSDIEIRDSEPGQVFVNAARNAVEKWEFEPVVENGVVVEKRAGVRMMFALE